MVADVMSSINYVTAQTSPIGEANAMTHISWHHKKRPRIANRGISDRKRAAGTLRTRIGKRAVGTAHLDRHCEHWSRRAGWSRGANSAVIRVSFGSD